MVKQGFSAFERMLHGNQLPVGGGSIDILLLRINREQQGRNFRYIIEDLNRWPDILKGSEHSTWNYGFAANKTGLKCQHPEIEHQIQTYPLQNSDILREIGADQIGSTNPKELTAVALEKALGGHNEEANFLLNIASELQFLTPQQVINYENQ